MRPETIDTEENLAGFLAAFAGCSLPKEEFTHAGHVTVAASYLYGSDVAAVLPRIRIEIRRFNESVGGANTETAGYHETLTVFWLRVVDGLLREKQPGSRLEAVRMAVAAFGGRSGLHKEYYSGDVVGNRVARREWVEPDLSAL
jgi:hypothetical protein